jgi:protein TonB
MFEQAMLPNTRVATRGVSLAASLTAQTMLVGLMLLVPLLFTDQLPVLRMMEALHEPVPPPPPPHVEIVASGRATPAIPGQSVGNRVFIPTTMPDLPATIIDEEPPVGATIGVVGAVGNGPGSTTGVIGSILTNLNRLAHVAPPPQPVAAAKPAEPPPPARIRQGGHVQEAMLVHRVMPVYPPLARQVRVQGSVHLEGIIGRDGTVQQLRVVDGHPLLVGAAMEAVRQWRYRPTLLNGDVVEVIAPIEVRFILN